MQKKNVLGSIRRHPGRALAICVPLVAASVFTGTSIASAQPEATLAVSPAAATAAPAPDVMNFDNHMPGTRVIMNKHAVKIHEPWNMDGCDHDYGLPDQCVPWKLPVPVNQACAWLRSNGFGPLKVYGTNRQHLPENAQGYVCAGSS